MSKVNQSIAAGLARIARSPVYPARPAKIVKSRDRLDLVLVAGWLGVLVVFASTDGHVAAA